EVGEGASLVCDRSIVPLAPNSPPYLPKVGNRSPHEAKRNAGMRVDAESAIPDSAPLLPGYDASKICRLGAVLSVARMKRSGMRGCSRSNAAGCRRWFVTSDGASLIQPTSGAFGEFGIVHLP